MLVDDTIRNASLDAIATLLDGCSLKFYDGANPVALATAHSGTLLGTLTLGDPAFDAAASGRVVAKAITPEYAVGSGDLESFRIFTPGSGSVCIAQGTCGELWDGTSFNNNGNGLCTMSLPTSLGHGFTSGTGYQVLWEIDNVIYGRVNVTVVVDIVTITLSGGTGSDWPATGTSGVRIGLADLLFDGVDVTESVTRIAIDTGNLVLLMASST